MVTIYSESFGKYYYTEWISFPTLITIVTILFVILFPFYIQFKNSLFWYTAADYTETPSVRYLNKAFISIVNDKGEVQNIQPDLNCMAEFEVNDNKINSYKCSKNLNIKEGKITNFQALLFFNYTIFEKVEVTFLTSCYINVNPSNGASKIKTDGVLKFKQKEPLVLKKLNENYFYSDYFNKDSPSAHFILYDEMLENFVYNYTYGTKYEFSADISASKEETTTLLLEFNINIPKIQDFIYYRTTMESLKFNWIDYLALFIPVFYICYSFLSMIFTQKVFQTTIITEIPLKRI